MSKKTNMKKIDISEILHLHFCRDTYINSNDMPLLLSEYQRNRQIKIINGYISPFTKFPKILRHILIGLDIETQYSILNRIIINGEKLLNKNTINPYSLILPANKIKTSWIEFVNVYIDPIVDQYKYVFNGLNIDINFKDLSYKTSNLHDAFIMFSNNIYRQISNNFSLPLLKMKGMEIEDKFATRFILKDQLSELLKAELKKERRYLRCMRGEYKKLLNGFSKNYFLAKKIVIERLDQDPTKALRRNYFTNDLDLIDLLDEKVDWFINLFKIDKIFSENYSVDKEEKIDINNYYLNIDMNSLLDKIFKNYRGENGTKIIIIQKFRRDFDYSIYDKLAQKYNADIYPSNIVTWRDDKFLREKKIKKMNFIFGLEFLLNSYVK